jgi:ADP-heptose:LPS heptosyltransferase
MVLDRAAMMLESFRERRAAGTLDSADTADLATRAAADFLSSSVDEGRYLRDAITLLCEISALPQPQLAHCGVKGLFPELIERLNDAFEPGCCDLYDRVMAQIIDFYRHQPRGEKLDALLRGFGIVSEADLLLRKARLSKRSEGTNRREIRNKVRKVILLSRITIGADVAVTSVLMSALQAAVPQAEVVLIGPLKLQELFQDYRGLRLRAVTYQREGGVLDRLTSWVDLVEAISQETEGLSEDEVWIVDPDSRMTQLGLLPVTNNERNYFFFESRRYRHPAIDRLGELAADWANQCWPIPDRMGMKHFPRVAPSAEALAFGAAVADRLRGRRHRHLVSISLGVGGNDRKRVSAEFEDLLVSALSQDASLVIDKGSTPEERDQVNRLVRTLKLTGSSVVEAKQGERIIWPASASEVDVFTWEGGIGMFAGLVAASDQFVGYDSAGQHIAAALGRPTLTVFVNASTPLFESRWRPTGPTETRVLSLTREDVVSKSVEEISHAAIALSRQLRRPE